MKEKVKVTGKGARSRPRTKGGKVAQWSCAHVDPKQKV